MGGFWGARPVLPAGRGVREMPPTHLAFLGDAVFELYARAAEFAVPQAPACVPRMRASVPSRVAAAATKKNTR